MKRGAPAAGSVLTWITALVFTVAIGAGITQTRILWGPTALEHSRDVRRLVFAQTYQAARAVYAPAADDRRAPVVLLGNSRIWLAARPSYLEPVLAHDLPDRPLRVDNLGIFGADIRDVEPLGRHVDALAPAMVVIAVGTSDLVPDPTIPWPTLAARVFDLGWRDGPVPPIGAAEHLDRWARTAWPLFRFREMARAAIEDRVVPASDTEAFPDHFTTTAAIFAYMHGPRGAEVEAAYQTWRRQPTLANFTAYLQIGSQLHLALVRRRAQDPAIPDATSPGVRQLEALLTGLASRHVPAMVVVMPENPLLAQDAANAFHQPGFSDAVAGLITATAARAGTTVVDARDWMPADQFLDFDHLLPELSGFQTRLGAEITHALRS
ncbi:MAG TPA: hypothetical protein VGR62_19430 [Candidatus Binatia bacterium]|jgi:hypothetical protein|nr:hypothetical protein [Candidatus Binatia bacterium]